MTLRLPNFFRSYTSTRLRATLNLKGLDYPYVPYVLRKGETRTSEYLKMKPAGLPTFRDAAPPSQPDAA
jgi:maleylpyruvate isomerase